MKTISERLNYLLDLKQITPYFLAKKTSIAQSTIGRILKQNSIPNNSTLVVICNYFNIYEDWFRSGSGDIFKNTADNVIKLDHNNTSANIEAIEGFKDILKDVEIEIAKLEADEKTLNNLQTLQGFYKLRASLLADISAGNN